jgi:LacI family transcriptional regulator
MIEAGQAPHDQPQPTLNDVARVSGFSKKTVSRVVNRLRVREATRERIEAAIARIGYTPDLAARELALKKARGTR